MTLVYRLEQNVYLGPVASDDSYGAPAAGGEDYEEYAYDDYSTDAAADSYAAAGVDAEGRTDR